MRQMQLTDWLDGITNPDGGVEASKVESVVKDLIEKCYDVKLTADDSTPNLAGLTMTLPDISDITVDTNGVVTIPAKKLKITYTDAGGTSKYEGTLPAVTLKQYGTVDVSFNANDNYQFRNDAIMVKRDSNLDSRRWLNSIIESETIAATDSTIQEVIGGCYAASGYQFRSILRIVKSDEFVQNGIKLSSVKAVYTNTSNNQKYIANIDDIILKQDPVPTITVKFNSIEEPSNYKPVPNGTSVSGSAIEISSSESWYLANIINWKNDPTLECPGESINEILSDCFIFTLEENASPSTEYDYEIDATYFAECFGIPSSNEIVLLKVKFKYKYKARGEYRAEDIKEVNIGVTLRRMVD